MLCETGTHAALGIRAQASTNQLHEHGKPDSGAPVADPGKAGRSSTRGRVAPYWLERTKSSVGGPMEDTAACLC